MLDIRTLLLTIPDDRFEATAALRAAEIAVFPLLRRARPASGLRPAAREQEVLISN